MEIVITAWALDSYLELKHAKVFSEAEYKKKLRPDVLLLKNYPKDSKFQNDKFWSLASEGAGTLKISDGYKMKWLK